MHTEYRAPYTVKTDQRLGASHHDDCDRTTPTQLPPNTDWFTEGGMTPEGKWWIAPTPSFIKDIWHGCIGDDLRNRGFRLRHDGHHIGAAQHTVIYLPDSPKPGRCGF